MTKKTLVLFAVACACMLAASCSHNGFFVGQGRVLSISGSGLTYVNGIFASDMSRENTEVEVEIQDSDGIGNATGTSQLEGGFKIRRRIGKQITGYLVDFAEVAPDAAKEYVSGASLEDVGQMERLPGYKGVGTAGEVPAKKDAKEADGDADGDEGACETCGDGGAE